MSTNSIVNIKKANSRHKTLAEMIRMMQGI